MKKAICFSALGTELPLKERLQILVDAGFDGIEVRNMAGNELEEMKNTLSEFPLEVHSVMNSGHWKFPFSAAEPDVVEEGMRIAREAIETAHVLGAETVLLVPAVVNENVTYEQAMERSKKNISELIPMAEEKKVILAVENVWNKFLLSPIEFAEYVDSFQSEWVKAYFDVGNILLYGYPQHWIKSLGSRIKKIHLKDFRLSDKAFVPLLEGDVDYPAVMKSLKEIGYDNYLTAEVGVDKTNLRESVNKIADAINKIMSM